MTDNVYFGYLYRDGSNYKKFAGEIFANPDRICIKEAETKIREYCSDGEYFIAEQVDVPDVFLWNSGEYQKGDDDHCWHEFEGLSSEEGCVTDDRTLTDIIEIFKNASASGWNEFDIFEKN